MQREIRLPLSRSQHLIENADILLFRHPHSIFSPGFWVAKYTLSLHSHVALAWRKDIGVQVLEFKEFIGGRVFPLEKYIENGYIIDVYRVAQSIKFTYLNSPPIVNGHKPTIEYEQLDFTEKTALNILAEGKDLVSCGLRYGLVNIFWIFLRMLSPVRIFINSNNDEKKPKHWICSNFCAYLYRKYYIKLVNDISDSFITPAEIAQSSSLSYLFTVSEI